MSKKIFLGPGDRILICRTDRIGDLILSIPLIESMKVNFPDNKVDVLASSYASPVLENNKYINNIITVDREALENDKDYQKNLADRLAREKYRVAMVLFPQRDLCKILHKIKIPVRVGTARRFHSVYFNRFLFHSRKANKKHEAEYNLDFLELFECSQKIMVPHIYLKGEEIDSAARLLAENNINKNFIAIHPGSGGSADSWPLGNFIKLYYLLVKDNYSVVFTGSAEERDKIDRSNTETGLHAINLAGKTDIRTLAGVLLLANVVVANSTGPLHLAAAVGTKVVGLYPSARAMSPVRWGPVGEGHMVIKPGENAISNMESIEPEQVADAVRILLARTEVAK